MRKTITSHNSIFAVPGKKLVLAAAFAASVICGGAAHAQTITTFAGNGTYGSDGDGGPAVDATFNELGGMAVDHSGNIYIVDASNVTVRRVNTSGIITKFAGNGGWGTGGDGCPATAATFGNLYGVTIDGSGNAFIADGAHYMIRKVNSAGIISTVAGTGVHGHTGDGGPATAAQITIGFRMTTDASGNLYFADAENNVVRKVSTSGIITTVAGTGSRTYSGDGGPATAAGMTPLCVAFDAAGDLLISDYYNHRIRKVNSSGIITTVIGTGVAGYSGDGGDASEAEIAWTMDMSVDGCGNLYLAEAGNSVIRMVDPSGIITTVAGNGDYGYSGDGGDALDAEIGVTAVLADEDGNLYIADSDNPVVRKVTRTCGGYKPSVKQPGTAQAFTIYPNPASETFNATVTSRVATSAEMRITDVTGRLISQKTIGLQTGTQTISVDASHLAAGTYFVTLDDNGMIQTQKLAIMK